MKKTYTFTGNTAIKKAKFLNDELMALREKEHQESKISYISESEIIQTNYNLQETHEKYMHIVQQIVILKKALKDFNSKHRGPLTELTVDEILVLLPMVKCRMATLCDMKNKQRLTRITKANVSEFLKLLYSPEKAYYLYQETMDMITNLQEDLNYLNCTHTFDVELDLDY